MQSDIPIDEARHSLGEIESTMRETRALAAAAASPILYTWGAVWALAYGLCQFRPQWSGITWAVLASLGAVLTVLVSRRAPVRSDNDGRFGASWVLLFVFAAVWFAVLVPWNAMSGVDPMEMQRSIGAFAATLAMFAYVMMGLWWDRFFMWLGIAVTALTLVGYFAFPAYFNIWMAVFGGGLLLLSGVLIKRRWRAEA